MVKDAIPSLTRWQERRRKGVGRERFVMGLLFAALAAAMIVYFGALVRIIGSVFGPGAGG